MVDRRGKTKIVQVINYYPFGGLLDDTKNEKDVQIRKYGGKELDRMHGLDLYDYSARQYDPALCQFTSMDPLCEKYYHISPYAYCAGNPVRYVDTKGKAIETAWDIANVAIDIASLSNNIDKYDYASAAVDALCLVGDGLAAAVPFIPGGFGSAVKASRAVDNVTDATITARNTFQENIRAGKEFEQEMLQKSINEGLEVYDQVLLVPQNGLGNIAGNRTYVDQLIHNSDGTWTIVETKLSNHTPLSKGQRRAMLEVEEGNGMFEVRSAHHDYFRPGQQIYVYDWQRVNKFEW